MFSKQESMTYITNVLGIKHPEDEMKTNRLEFLNKMICAFYSAMPFQNVTLMSKPLPERHVPTLDEIKTPLLNGTGGLCPNLNISFFMLLKAIGFDVYLNLSRIFPEQYGKDANNYHSIILVKSVIKENDLYLIDVGAAHPAFQAINLEFNDETPVFRDSYLLYKFIRRDRDIIRREQDRSILFLAHDKSSDVPKSGEFWPFYDFTVSPTNDIDQLREIFEDIYKDTDLTPFHKSVRAVKFIDRKLVLISNSKLVREANDGIINIEILPDDEAIVCAYKTHFPELDEVCIRRALQNWRNL